MLARKERIKRRASLELNELLSRGRFSRLPLLRVRLWPQRALLFFIQDSFQPLHQPCKSYLASGIAGDPIV
jgi:hypothetical protein